MKRKTGLALVLTSAIALTAVPALADPSEGECRGGMMGRHMMERMGGHGGMMGRHGGGRMMHGMMRGGEMGHGPMAGMMREADANDDGEISPDEVSALLAAKLKEYDADGDGTLSIAEFETLHSATIRPRMVDRFQHLDEDGDGKITADEMQAPADKMARMKEMRGRHGGEGCGEGRGGHRHGHGGDNDN